MAVVLAVNVAFACEGAAADDHARPEAKHWLLFSGLDLWRDGTFLHGGVVFSPQGLDESGFVVKALGSVGRYRFHSGALGRDVTGQQTKGFITPGWRFVHDRLQITGFVGIETQRHVLTPDDPSAGLRGSYVGARGEVNVWYEPTPQTMLSLDADLASIGNSYNARAAYGWRAFDRFYAGPDLQFFGDPNYDEMRFGIHITGLKMHATEWTTGLGYARNSDGRSGPYVRLGVLGRL